MTLVTFYPDYAVVGTFVPHTEHKPARYKLVQGERTLTLSDPNAATTMGEAVQILLSTFLDKYPQEETEWNALRIKGGFVAFPVNQPIPCTMEVTVRAGILAGKYYGVGSAETPLYMDEDGTFSYATLNNGMRWDMKPTDWVNVVELTREQVDEAHDKYAPRTGNY